jgi:beta-galactosidase
MKRFTVFFIACFFLSLAGKAIDPRVIINLNGIWDFDQTTNSFPPVKFTRKIPVPGLVHLAEPKIDDFEKFFKRPDKVEFKEQHDLFHIDYTPRYSWYRKKVFIPRELEGSEAVISNILLNFKK